MERAHSSPQPKLDKYFLIIENEMNFLMSQRALHFDCSFKKSFEDAVMQRVILWSATYISKAISNIPRSSVPSYIDYDLILNFDKDKFFIDDNKPNYEMINKFYIDNALPLSYWAHQFLNFDFI